MSLHADSFSPTDHLQPGWADKSNELLVKKPVYLRGWFLQLMVAVLLLAVTAGATGASLLWRWHRGQQAELAAQRRSVEAFARSAVFDAFAREADAQLVAAHNFILLRPSIARDLLPAVTTAEKTHRLPPWAGELPPLPVSAAGQPARVQAAMQATAALLEQRGFAFAPERLAEARRTFLRLLAPHARIFLAQNTLASFPALFLDRSMQDSLLAAYAQHADATRAEIERTFAFYTLVGPALWQEIDRQHTHPGSTTTAF